MIFHSGSPGQSMMAVLTGSVRLSVPSAQGKEIVLADLEPGDVFGEIALLDGKERTADAMALTNCDLMMLERRDVLPFLERHPEVALKLMEVLCEKLRRTNEQLSELTFLELPARLAKVLLRVMRRNPVPSGSQRNVKLAVSQRELGSMIGGTRESVNRCLGEWQRRGIVKLKEGWIVVLSPDALTELAETG
jgi:CRP/FNR family transcriptional regulator, cyclic AMP receptor protein